jgi:hypothetical protein
MMQPLDLLEATARIIDAAASDATSRIDILCNLDDLEGDADEVSIARRLFRWWPPAGQSVNDDDRATLQFGVDLLDHLSVPLACATIASAAFQHRIGRRDQVAHSFAQAAQDHFALRARKTDEIEEQHQVDSSYSDFLIESADALLSIGDGPSADHVADLELVVTSEVSRAEPRWGILLRTSECLATHAAGSAALDKAIETALLRTDEPWNVGPLWAIKRSTGRATLDEVHSAEIRAHLDRAAHTEPLVAMTHLSTAQRLAADYGMKDLSNEASSRLQAFAGRSPAELGMGATSFETTMSSEIVESALQPVRATSTWQDAFHTWMISRGELDPNAASAAATKMIQQAPFTYLFPCVLLGADGLPRHTFGTSPEERIRHAIYDYGKLHVAFHGFLDRLVLQAFVERFGVPPLVECIDFFSPAEAAHVDRRTAELLGRALRHLLNGDVDEAAHLAVPRVEHLVRSLIICAGLGVYRAQRESQPGQYPGLGTLTPMLRYLKVDDNWINFIETVFTGSGLNARNDIGHGFPNFDPMIASLAAIRASVYLSRAVSVERPGQPADTATGT